MDPKVSHSKEYSFYFCVNKSLLAGPREPGTVDDCFYTLFHRQWQAGLYREQEAPPFLLHHLVTQMFASTSKNFPEVFPFPSSLIPSLAAISEGHNLYFNYLADIKYLVHIFLN